MIHTCDQCGVTFKRWGSRPSRYCSLDCRNIGYRGRTRVEKPVKGRIESRLGHPLAPPSGRVAAARIVLYDKIGPGTHPCHWCGTPVTWMAGAGPRRGTLVADHLNFDRADDSPGNLVPACANCNAHRTRQGNRNRIQDGELTMIWSGVRTRAVTRVCERCGETFLTVPANVRQGKARFCSRSCARRKH